MKRITWGVLGLFVLAVFVGTFGLVGCRLSGDWSGDGPGPALGGAILLNAVFSGGTTTSLEFAASQREKPVGAIFAASRARDFKARITVGKGPATLHEIATATSNALTVTTSYSNIPAGKKQVLVEIVSADAPGDAYLKGYVVPIVSDGQTTSATADVNFESTAKALIYEAWVGTSTETIDSSSFTPPETDVKALADKIVTAVVKDDALATASDFILDPTIKTTAAGIAETISPPTATGGPLATTPAAEGFWKLSITDGGSQGNASWVTVMEVTKPGSSYSASWIARFGGSDSSNRISEVSLDGAALTFKRELLDGTGTTVRSTEIWKGTVVGDQIRNGTRASPSGEALGVWTGARSSASALVSSGISLNPASATVESGAIYDLAEVTVTATFIDSSKAPVTNVTWSGTGVSGRTFTAPTVAGTVTLTCGYTEGGVTRTATFVVTVTAGGRFSRDVNGVITDGQTGLQWLEGADQAVSWVDGQAWIGTLGNGWRAPLRSELSGLYIPDSTRMGGASSGIGSTNPEGPFALRLDPVFRLDKAYWVWAEARDAASAWYFGFADRLASWTGNADSPWNARMFAVRSSGNVTKPSSPTGLNATAGVEKVDLSWSPVAGAGSYNLYFSTSAGVTIAAALAGTATGTTFRHMGLKTGTYYYVITAGNAGGQSEPSQEVSVAYKDLSALATAISGQNLTTSEKLGQLEALFLQARQENPKAYAFNLCNELRHLYSVAGQQDRSYQMIEEILYFEPMNDYMLQIAANWQMTSNPQQALSALLALADANPGRPSIVTACYLKSYQLAQQLGNDTDAAGYLDKARQTAPLTNPAYVEILKNYQ